MSETGAIRDSFMFRIVSRLDAEGVFSSTDRVLVVGAGEFDRAVLDAVGYHDAIYSNVVSDGGDNLGETVFEPGQLGLPDDSVDLALCHAVLHHASRPHQLVAEMYRVSRKGVLFFESQDSWAMRALVRLHITTDYEKNAILDHNGQSGGVDGTAVPNHVYRWTRREVQKLIRSLDPAREPSIRYFHEWIYSWPSVYRRLAKTPLRAIPEKHLRRGVDGSIRAANHLVGRFGNGFCVLIRKDRAALKPWMTEIDGKPVFHEAVSKQRKEEQ